MFLYNGSISLSLQGTVEPPAPFPADTRNAERPRQVRVQAEHWVLGDMPPE